MMDGNSLYGSITSQLGIFIDWCTSATSTEELSVNMDMSLPLSVYDMVADDVIWNGS